MGAHICCVVFRPSWSDPLADRHPASLRRSLSPSPSLPMPAGQRTTSECAAEENLTTEVATSPSREEALSDAHLSSRASPPACRPLAARRQSAAERPGAIQRPDTARARHPRKRERTERRRREKRASEEEWQRAKLLDMHKERMLQEARTRSGRMSASDGRRAAVKCLGKPGWRTRPDDCEGGSLARRQRASNCA